MLVYVLNKNKQPLMPCSPTKARHLLNDKKAKVIRTEPFTIQLLYGSSGYKQPITLGVDAGSKHIGLSATTVKRELYASEVELRFDITERIALRKIYRRKRRNRKIRYRESKFLNRVRSKNKGWLAPSVENKIDMHIKVINNIFKILPITKIIVETASFDINKMNEDLITSKNNGNMKFWNTRQYVLWRDNYKCQCCHGKSKDPVLNVHHIESRITGGNSHNNLVTLCRTCHNKYHKGEIKLKIKRGKVFRDATFMNIMRKTFFRRLNSLYDNVEQTYGYITKNTRITKGLPKTHCIDAFCITGNTNAELLDCYFYQKQVRRTNRQIHKKHILKGGRKKKNQSPKYVKGFQLYDKVKFRGKLYYLFGRRSTGRFDIRSLSGEKVRNGSVSYKYLEKIESRKSILTERRSRSFA